MLKLYDLTIEYKHAPLGLDEVQVACLIAEGVVAGAAVARAEDAA